MIAMPKNPTIAMTRISGCAELRCIENSMTSAAWVTLMPRLTGACARPNGMKALPTVRASSTISASQTRK